MNQKMDQVLVRNVINAVGITQEAKEKCLQFIKEHSGNYFSRENEVGHITGSMFVMNQPRTKVLLTHHKKFNAWLQLGGHNDIFTQTPLETGIREMFEEGFGNKDIPYQLISFDPLDIDIHDVNIPNLASHQHYDFCFSCIIEDEESMEISDESHDLKWTTFEEILNDKEGKFEDRLRRMVKNSMLTTE